MLWNRQIHISANRQVLLEDELLAKMPRFAVVQQWWLPTVAQNLENAFHDSNIDEQFVAIYGGCAICTSARLSSE